jgi:competence protein ComEC
MRGDSAGLRVLLTGDIEPEAQSAVMAAPGRFDIAKVPHHASRNQHPRFAPWADTSVALITVGADNDYGHPAPETLSAWQATGSRLLRTDIHGGIAIVRTEQGWGTVTQVS